MTSARLERFYAGYIGSTTIFSKVVLSSNNTDHGMGYPFYDLINYINLFYSIS
jgi:hypothetical protein